VKGGRGNQRRRNERGKNSPTPFTRGVGGGRGGETEHNLLLSSSGKNKKTKGSGPARGLKGARRGNKGMKEKKGEEKKMGKGGGGPEISIV